MVFLFILILFVTSGCSTDPQVPSNNSNNELISGVNGIITAISYDDNTNVTSILVEGEHNITTENYYYDKAHVSITEVSQVYIGESTEEASPNELKEGINVKVIFYGPVAESYPVQAKAKIIKIIENK